MAKKLKIITHPNPILRQKSRLLTAKDLGASEFQKLALDMEKTMREKDGAGLAAPQIGQNIRFAVVSDGKNKVIFMVNPQITRRSWAQEIAEEGCLSVLDAKGQNIYGPVKRHKKISCLYFDLKGQKQKVQAENMLARVIQHELDHLDGILFIDRLEK